LVWAGPGWGGAGWVVLDLAGFVGWARVGWVVLDFVGVTRPPSDTTIL